MRSSKDRTIERKRRQKATGAKRTERSRARRVANKHKREEIHAINPDMKVVVINQKTFDKHGTEIEVIDGKIKAVTPADYDDAVIEYQEVTDTENIVRNEGQYNAETDGGRAIDDQIEKERIGVFDRLADKFRRK
jgi:hypothetical protein